MTKSLIASACDMSPPSMPSPIPPFEHRHWTVQSNFVFASRLSGNSFSINAGKGSTGPHTAIVGLPDSAYGCEMADAIVEAVKVVNKRWGLPEAALSGEFTGTRPTSSTPASTG
ncbi:conserved hypothetical protein [Hyphomicrobiales bacterium]|nr:conserved hypothetical protein [Hyphomicrobiales bacterium]CAH1669112.1 conserved hypothetical protein [Hyphomicrobiales bacterium]